jgi:GNAT superfamily N-acetyltransferase
MELTSRPATPADAQALVPLFEQLGYPTEAEVIAGRLAQLTGIAAFVALHEDLIVGFVTVGIRSAVVDGRSATIEGFVVRDGYRSRGVGARLLADAERWALERGCTRVVVRSNTIRERAHRFYLREGYKVRKSQVVFEKQL